MSIQQQLNFLKQVEPFSALSLKELTHLASALDVVYFPLKTTLELSSRASSKQSTFLYFVIKGHIAEFDESNRQRAVYGANTFFGDGLLLKRESYLRYEVIEEAIAYRLPQAVFLELMSQPEIQGFFIDDITAKLNRLHAQIQAESSSEALMGVVEEAPLQSLVEVNESTGIGECVQKMQQYQTDACVVHFSASNEVGIVTSIDLLNALALDHLSVESEVGSLATVPIISVHQFDYLFNALLKMTKFRINRLVVRSDDGLVGVLHQKDLMGMFANQSGLVVLSVQQAEKIEDLKSVIHQIDALVINLNNRGVKTHYIAKLVNELHRKIMEKVFEFLKPFPELESGCLLVMGSEGRAEQVIRTDQDNAFILPDSAKNLPGLVDFMQEFTHSLIELGFPPCPGNIMVSNPVWCQTLSNLKQQLREWMTQPTADAFMNLSIFFDADVVLGDESLLLEAKQVMLTWVAANQHFLPHFAKPVLQFETPISFFGKLVTDKKSHKSQIDLKKGGVFPIVHGVRCLAIEKGILKTNTHWRIKALMEQGVLTDSFGIELGETLNFLNTLRLESMVDQVRRNKMPNNFLQVSDLTPIQQDLLKEAFNVVNRFKKLIDHHFKVSAVL
ncbi:signal transduction protein [Hydrogenovibrio crunogenus]|uniref:Signal transduction protein n=1 Tax=Hydrogenovibrio crunogenus TaxID=39765 RepID=A0A4P7NZD6_9GAMM|nr:putative nucleotidyltransferase substrate binding domain-containing protein [Hydrogenovibrio crunogenus]QBZ83143.1 signal transduction protein [Hydrogenovibrio crunogenus]RUM93122.1 MAG: nucleotidyltransferase [Thiomicrospira sp.]